MSAAGALPDSGHAIVLFMQKLNFSCDRTQGSGWTPRIWDLFNFLEFVADEHGIGFLGNAFKRIVSKESRVLFSNA